MIISLAAIQKAPEPIPELRPPKGEITTNFPDSVFYCAALLLSLLVLIVGRIQQIRKPRPVLSARTPLQAFRQELAEIARHGGDPLDRSIHAVRRYVCETFEIGSEGLTNEELIAEFAEHPLAREQPVATLRDFLVGNDFVRFAPVAANRDDCLQRATDLVELLEETRLAALPPPLPVTL